MSTSTPGTTCILCKAWIPRGEDHICSMWSGVETGDNRRYAFSHEQAMKEVACHIICPHCKKVIEVIVKEAESTTEGR